VWVTGRPVVLSTFFVAVGFWAFVKAGRIPSHSAHSWVISHFAFAAALLTYEGVRRVSIARVPPMDFVRADSLPTSPSKPHCVLHHSACIRSGVERILPFHDHSLSSGILSSLWLAHTRSSHPACSPRRFSHANCDALSWALDRSLTSCTDLPIALRMQVQYR
jgi:hypothetical protein